MSTPDPTVLRIIDANHNRAREALRVIEDYARFIANDAAGSAVVKELRHELRAALDAIPGNALLGARDTPGDVGTTITTAAEQQRTDARSVCLAATKRLPEALRTMEEYVKTFDPAVAARLEALRYRTYSLEPRILLRADRAARMQQCRLYVLLTAELCRKDPHATCEALIAGGADCIQLREKGLADRELLEQARSIGEVCLRHNVLFIVNDRPDIARLAQADGVHVGQDDLSVADARRIVGADRLVGISTHNPRQLDAALADQPDYVAVGPMFASTTKPQDHIPGDALLRRAAQHRTVPVVPIGGITLDNAAVLREAGAQCVCVCSAILEADDVAEMTARFRGL